MKYILASSSPRRQELLKKVVSQFDVIPSNANENLSLYFSQAEIEKFLMFEPQELVKKLAYVKACEVAKKVQNGIIIGSDTGVFFENKILGKPFDMIDAVKMLKYLSAQIHEVITGVCCILMENGVEKRVLISSSTTEVEFKMLSDEVILKYVQSGLCFGKAGAYGIQDGYPLVEKYSGSFENVMGLPTKLVGQMIKDIE